MFARICLIVLYNEDKTHKSIVWIIMLFVISSFRYNQSQPVYINVVREPLSRLASWYYFQRFQPGHERDMPWTDRNRVCSMRTCCSVNLQFMKSDWIPKLIFHCLLVMLILYSYVILPGRKSWPLNENEVMHVKSFKSFFVDRSALYVSKLMGQHECMVYYFC